MSENNKNPNKLTWNDWVRLAELVFTYTIRSWCMYFLLGGVLVFRYFSPPFAVMWGIVTGLCLLMEVLIEASMELPDDLEKKLSIALEPTMQKVEQLLGIAAVVADVVQDIQYEVEDEVDEVIDFVDHVHFTIYDRFLRIKYALQDKFRAWLDSKLHRLNNIIRTRF